jgi:secreted PhoX family phosphatase
LTILDPTAEPTGFAFSADGQTAYLSIQHSDDAVMPVVDNYPTDDILRITGFRIPKR